MSSEFDQPVVREWLGKSAAHMSLSPDEYRKRMAWAAGRGHKLIERYAGLLDEAIPALRFVAEHGCRDAVDGLTCFEDGIVPEDSCLPCVAHGTLARLDLLT